MAKGRAELEIVASDSKLAAGLARARAKIGEWSGAVARGLGKTMNTPFKLPFKGGKLPGMETGSRALGAFGGQMLSRGVDAVKETADEVRDFDRNLTRFGIAGSKSTAELDALAKVMRQVSVATGVNKSLILAGAQTYVDLTGDVKGAEAAQKAFARISQAAGAEVADVATATAAMQAAMGLDASNIEDVFSGLIVQGKKGAIGVKDLAGELAELAPQFAQFAGAKGADGVLQLGAAMQVVRIGAGSASSAATQLSSLIGALSDSQTVAKLQAIGVSVYDAKGKMKSFADVTAQMAKSKQLGKAQVMSDIFGRKEAQNALRTIRNNISAMHELTAAGKDNGAVQRDLTTFLESRAGRIDAQMNRMKETIAEAFTPERIQGFVNMLEKVGGVVNKIVGGIERLAKWLDEERTRTIDEQTTKNLADAKGFTPQGKRNAADDLDKIADAKMPVDMMAAELDSPMGWLTRVAAPSLPTGDHVRQFGGTGDRVAASLLRAQANRDEKANANLAANADPWNRGTGPSAMPAGFGAPIDFQGSAKPMSPEQFLAGIREAVAAGMTSVKLEVGNNKIADAAAKGGALKARGAP